MTFVPYLNYEGNAEEALNFYADALGASIQGIMRYSEAPPSDDMPPVPDDYKDKIIHATLVHGTEELYLSDTFPGMSVNFGDSVSINIGFDSEEGLREAFDKLAVGGTITMPVAQTFWGAVFGAVTDKFGINWSLNYQLPQE